MALTDYRADAMRCTRCSYCKWIPFDLVQSHQFAKGCPSIEAGKFHAYSAGGKLVTALSLMDGRSEVTDQVVDVAFKCQLCGNCDVACKLCRYDMEPILALRELRAHLVEMDRVPESYRPLIERTRAALAGKGPKTPADRNAWAEGLGLKDPAAEPVDVVFYAGCKYSLEESLRETVRTQVRLLQLAGLSVGLFENGCCGGLADKMGYRDEAAEAGSRMLEQWADAGVKTVVTPCADCRHVFTRVYPELDGAWEDMPQILHTVECVDQLDQGRAARAHHACPHDRHLPRPVQPRPPGRALHAVGRASRRRSTARPWSTTRRGRGTTAPTASTSRRATCSPPSPASSSSRWSAAARPPGAAAPAAPAARRSPSTRPRPPPSASRRRPRRAPRRSSPPARAASSTSRRPWPPTLRRAAPAPTCKVHDVLELVALSAGVAKEAS